MNDLAEGSTAFTVDHAAPGLLTTASATGEVNHNTTILRNLC